MISKITGIVKAGIVSGLFMATFSGYAGSDWIKVSEALPFKSAPVEQVSSETVASAIGVNASIASDDQKVMLDWAAESLNSYGFARVSTSRNSVSTVWYANNPERGPYKGHTGLVIKQCDRSSKPNCFSRAL
ncbi:MAG: hypothetical protein OXT49_06100 [Gammaproteobacteria bacterium]|nr:hypothetical protein [Gammaproteobacteria bacterium]